jgi:hypothetical protein
MRNREWGQRRQGRQERQGSRGEEERHSDYPFPMPYAPCPMPHAPFLTPNS